MHCVYARAFAAGPAADPLPVLPGPEPGLEHAAQLVATTAAMITAASQVGDRRGPACWVFLVAPRPGWPASPPARCVMLAILSFLVCSGSLGQVRCTPRGLTPARQRLLGRCKAASGMLEPSPVARHRRQQSREAQER
jgi:hypothetical protein